MLRVNYGRQAVPGGRHSASPGYLTVVRGWGALVAAPGTPHKEQIWEPGSSRCSALVTPDHGSTQGPSEPQLPQRNSGAGPPCLAGGLLGRPNSVTRPKPSKDFAPHLESNPQPRPTTARRPAHPAPAPFSPHCARNALPHTSGRPVPHPLQSVSPAGFPDH